MAAVYAEILKSSGAEDASVAVVSVDPQGTAVDWAEAVEKAGCELPFRFG
ncbi:hypothetical protein ACIGW8_26700 [Streptomyces sioyaensis]